MLREEFEEMVGKEVDYETFAKYEEIYYNLPESYTKQDFIDLLDVDKIPESREAIKRREEQALFREKIKSNIRELKERNEVCQNFIDEWQGYDFHQNLVRAYENEIKDNNFMIKQYKFILD